MQGKIYSTPKGDIYYWTDFTAPDPLTLVLLPGLTADHRLFGLQVKAFAGRYRLLVWDAPGHGASRPFPLNFSLRDQAVWLHGILEQEGIQSFCLVGQSMGGYVAQCFLQEYPGEAAGFIAIDSAPLKRRYTTRWEIALLRHCGPVYRLYPWRALRVAGADGCADTPYGRALMRRMMDSYSPAEYAALAAHGFRMLADALEANLPYRIDCPALLFCGVHDRAASTKRYNRAWSAGEGLPLVWVPAAGHNSNTDNPVCVDRQIGSFVDKLLESGRP